MELMLPTSIILSMGLCSSGFLPEGARGHLAYLFAAGSSAQLFRE